MATAAAKSPQALKRTPRIAVKSKPDLPINSVVRELVNQTGPSLETTTRCNQQLAYAAAMSHLYGSDISFGSDWVKSSVDQILRLANSIDGAGRKDLIAALAAGQIPGEYYTDGGRNREFSFIEEAAGDDA